MRTIHFNIYSSIKTVGATVLNSSIKTVGATVSDGQTCAAYEAQESARQISIA